MSGKPLMETKEKWEYRIGREILDALWEKLLKEYPYLAQAVSLLTPQPMDTLRAFATDGKTLYYPAERLIALYRKNERFLLRALLHLLLHCLYGHLWLPAAADQRSFHLSCDVFAESLIDRLDSPILKRPLTFVRQELYHRLEETKAVGPARIGEAFSDTKEEDKRSLAAEFFVDDHRFWPRPSREKQKNAEQEVLQKSWEEALQSAKRERRKMGVEDGNGGEVLFEGELKPKEGNDYQKLLRRFSSFTEELGINPEEFDLGYYTYGLSLYGDVPLIEPLESREERRLRDFILVIDTSYSTKGELVKGFLREAFGILLGRQNFRRNARIHLLQCDDRVRSDDVVKNEEEARALLTRFQPHGGGGTDFGPAFSHVEELRRKRQIRKPAGLLYFTDGRGRWPDKKPDYPTAFLFLEDYDESAVPSWCIHLRLKEEKR